MKFLYPSSQSQNARKSQKKEIAVSRKTRDDFLMEVLRNNLDYMQEEHRKSGLNEADLVRAAREGLNGLSDAGRKHLLGFMCGHCSLVLRKQQFSCDRVVEDMQSYLLVLPSPYLARLWEHIKECEHCQKLVPDWESKVRFGFPPDESARI